MKKILSVLLAVIFVVGLWVGNGVSVVADENSDAVIVQDQVDTSTTGFRRGPGPTQDRQGSMQGDMLSMLDISIEEYTGYRANGLTLSQIVEKSGKDTEELKTDLLEQREEFWNQRVEDGWMTEKQKELRIEQFKQNFELMLSRDSQQRAGFGPGMGRRGFGGNGCFGNGFQGQRGMMGNF